MMTRFAKLAAAAMKADQPSILLSMDPDQIEKDRHEIDQGSGDNSNHPNIPNTSPNPPTGVSHLA